MLNKSSNLPFTAGVRTLIYLFPLLLILILALAYIVSWIKKSNAFSKFLVNKILIKYSHFQQKKLNEFSHHEFDIIYFPLLASFSTIIVIIPGFICLNFLKLSLFNDFFYGLIFYGALIMINFISLLSLNSKFQSLEPSQQMHLRGHKKLSQKLIWLTIYFYIFLPVIIILFHSAI
jgi:hypothetical protein